MADSAPTPSLTVDPSTVEVNAGAVCQFKAGPAGTPVDWKIQPSVGTIDANGVYAAPNKKEVRMPQTVIVTATAESGGQSATATLDLVDNPAKISWLAWYGIIVALIIGVILLATWSSVYQRPASPIVVVNPSIVTLDPTNKDEKVSFTATALGDSKATFVWSVEPPDAGDVDAAGVFHVKQVSGKDPIDRVVKITARNASDSSRNGSAEIHVLTGKHLEIAPVTASVFASQQVTYRTLNDPAKWSASRSDIASITADGVFTAGVPGQTSLVQVTAWGAVPHQQAAVAIVISVPFPPNDFKNWPILVFVIVCGALGSMIYYTSSFVAYVGNRSFRSSWFWFYISRPFVGGGLAVIFFFLALSGMTAGTGTSNVAMIGLVSALVGLFSDKAVKKLSDVLDVLLSTSDPRKDKLADSKQADTKTQPASTTTATTTAAAAGKMKIDVTPKTAAANQDTPLQVTGTSFKAADFNVTVNGQSVTPTEVTDQSFKLVVQAAQVKSPKITIRVTANQASDSADIAVT
jgi:hypothetical protein